MSRAGPAAQFLAGLLLAAFALLTAGAAWAAPATYLFLGGDDPAQHLALLKRPEIAGAQVVYTWRELEPGEGHYDFSRIDADLATMTALGKPLYLQLQDRFFSPTARNVPDYILDDPAYGGGLAEQTDNAGENIVGSGWVAMQWNDALRARFQALLKALAAHVDGRVAGINLPETSFDLDEKHPPAGFTCDGYFNAELDNLAAAREAFSKSAVIQYVNFWPCEWNNDHRYMSRLFDFALAHDIGLGGPDVVPWRKGQMKNAYPFFNADKGKLKLVAMAVQEPTLTYTNPKTGKRFTQSEIVDFATDYLGTDIIFWTPEAPWLKALAKAD